MRRILTLYVSVVLVVCVEVRHERRSSPRRSEAPLRVRRLLSGGGGAMPRLPTAVRFSREGGAMGEFARCMRCRGLYRRGFTGMMGCPECHRRDAEEYAEQERRRKARRQFDETLKRRLSPTPPGGAE